MVGNQKRINVLLELLEGLVQAHQVNGTVQGLCAGIRKNRKDRRDQSIGKSKVQKHQRNAQQEGERADIVGFCNIKDNILHNRRKCVM